MTKISRQNLRITAPEASRMGSVLDGNGNEDFVAPQLSSSTVIGVGVPTTVALLRLPACTWTEVDGEVILELIGVLINGLDDMPKFSY